MWVGTRYSTKPANPESLAFCILHSAFFGFDSSPSTSHLPTITYQLPPPPASNTFTSFGL